MLTRTLNTLGDAEQILYMMADLMRDYISLGEIAGGLKALLQIMEEGKIDIQFLVGRAIEGTDCRLRETAGRLHRAGE